MATFTQLWLHCPSYSLQWCVLVMFTFFLRTRRLSKYIVWAFFTVAVAYLSGGTKALDPKHFFGLPRNAVLWQTAGRA